MHNYILYKAYSPGETHACAYSILKYLWVYNLKPPSSHSLVIYTNDPASLEAYGSFFDQFELKTISGNGSLGNTSEHRIIREFCSTSQGNVLYLGNTSYPVSELEPLFVSIENGSVYAQKPVAGKKIRENEREEIIYFGINTSRHNADVALASGKYKPAGSVIMHYPDFKEFNFLLRYFFKRYQEESIPNQVKLAASLNANEILERRNAFKKLPLYSRLIKTISGKGWGMKEVMRKLG